MNEGFKGDLSSWQGGELCEQMAGQLPETVVESLCYCGTDEPTVVVVTQGRLDDARVERFAREAFGADVCRIAWTSAEAIPPQWLRGAKGIITLGAKALSWVKYHVGGAAEILALNHPSYFFSRETPESVMKTVYEPARKFVRKLLN